MKKHKYGWEILDNKSLLNTKICDLNLNIKDSNIQVFIEQLYRELSQKGLNFKPHVWISTEWFSPYGVPGFAIPFYLFHPKLRELEFKFIGVVEGGTKEWLMKLLRHETGHAIDNGFLLRKSKKRQQLFGLSGLTYPVSYSPKPFSTNFVRHFDGHYAQAHPDEDWAETFAVWLDPKSNWRKKYTGLGAFNKLLLVEELMNKCRNLKQIQLNKEMPDEISSCQQTLQEYFDQKRQRYKINNTAWLPSAYQIRCSSSYLINNKKSLCKKLALITNKCQYIIDMAYKEIILAKREEGLPEKKRAEKQEEILYALASYVEEFLDQERHRIAM